jgi:hypothetical protein
MPGVFGTSTLPMAMGRVNRALYNNGIPPGFGIQLRGRLGAYYYGITSNPIRLYGSFAGLSYPFTY